MCMSKPKIPAAVPPPPPPPIVPKVEMGSDTSKATNNKKNKQMGTASLQIPLTGNTKSGLGY
jgi:hypothetical protein